jgi:Tfp pilus assembly protein PilO
VARRITPRERLLLLITAAAVLLFFTARPFFQRLADFGPRSERLFSEKTAVIAAYREAVGREGGLRAEAESLGTKIAAFEEALLPGATPPLAAADLQMLLKQLADKAGLKIQSEKILAHVRKDAYLEIPVQIVATGDIRTVKEFLVGVESSPVVIAVQDMSLRVVKRRQFVPETRTYLDISDLQANMTLVGLIPAERA